MNNNNGNSKLKLEQHYSEDGKLESPLLPGDIKNFLVDIDGTICDDIPNEEPHRMVDVIPFPDAVKVINQWYEEGHTITFFTSRTTAEHREITETWLRKWGFNYHFLLMDKPRGGNYWWIDNHFVKGVRYDGDFAKVLEIIKSTIKVLTFG